MQQPTAHAFSFEAINGGVLHLADYTGRVVLVVNTASACGFTPQYAGLERLWQDRREQGLVVIGVPSNDFGAQEPGADAEIHAFCTTRYGVTFPLTRKQTVLGADAHPFFSWIAATLGEDALPRWNFHKYLIAPDGTLAGAWPSRVAPDDPEVITAIGDLLA
jgi:glutathione peroxidase